METFLVVDDCQELAYLTKKMLQRNFEGSQVYAETQAPKALEVFEQIPACFDVVVSDFDMQPMSGMEFVQSVKFISPQTPVLLISAKCIGEQITYSAGADLFLKKPFDLEKLKHSITYLLNRKAAHESTGK